MEEQKNLIWLGNAGTMLKHEEKAQNKPNFQEQKVIMVLSDCDDITEEELFAALA